MSDLAARMLLFVHAPAHRDALLADGVAGARVPKAWLGYPRIHEPRWREPDEDDTPETFREGQSCTECGEDWPCPEAGKEDRAPEWHITSPPVDRPAALVLIHRGAVAVEGVDRLVRVLARVEAGSDDADVVALAIAEIHRGMAAYNPTLCERAATRGLGEIVEVPGGE